MGAMFTKATKPAADLNLLAQADPVFRKTHQPLLDAERNSRKNIMGTNDPEVAPAASAVNEINTPSLFKRRNANSAPAAGLAAKSLLGQ